MKINNLLTGLPLLLPIDVFAHPGHVEWEWILSNGRFEWVEGSLVLAALTVFLMNRKQQSARHQLSRVKTKNQKR